MDRELADAGEDAGVGLEHAADVIGRVHVGRVEPGDHRVEALLLLRRQRLVRLGDERVGERVVVERRIGLQVVGRRVVARVLVRPGLLQRDAEQGGAADLVSHDLEVPADVGALLDVVRQVEVRVVEQVAVRRRLGLCRLACRRCDREQTSEQCDWQRGECSPSDSSVHACPAYFFFATGVTAYGLAPRALETSSMAFCALTLLPAASSGGEMTAMPNLPGDDGDDAAADAALGRQPGLVEPLARVVVEARRGHHRQHLRHVFRPHHLPCRSPGSCRRSPASPPWSRGPWR